MSRELNLVPKQKVNAKANGNTTKVIVIGLIVIGVSVAASIGYSLAMKIHYQNRAQELRTEVDRGKAKVEQRNNLERQIAVTKKQIEKANSLIREKDTDQLVKDMRQCILVDGNEITFMDYFGKNLEDHKNEVSVKGTATSKEALMKAWANLRENDKFKYSQLESWKFNEEDQLYHYEGKISFEEGGFSNEAN